jgi:hypothetical protein
MKLMTLSMVLLAACATAIAQTDERQPMPSASAGGKVEIIPPKPLDASADPVNARSNEATTDGLAIVITIDGANVTLDSAAFARVPRTLARADRKVEGDVVRAVAFVGSQRIASSVVPDTTVNASEGAGIVRVTKRQVVLVLAADRPIERVEIEAPATNARGSLDVRSAYAEICKADPGNKWCPSPAAR